MMITESPVVAYVYDRQMVPDGDALRVRMGAIVAYADVERMRIGGYWLDKGEDATSLAHRPALDFLCNKMRYDVAEGAVVRPVCLVYDVERIAVDERVRGGLIARVFAAGGIVRTVKGQWLTPDGVALHTPITGGTT
jgi:hypothetical protein